MTQQLSHQSAGPVSLSWDEVRALRVHLTLDCPRELRALDVRLGIAIGADPSTLYQDVLFFHRDRLVREDGTLDLNMAEELLAPFGFRDLNLAERVLSDWRDSR